MIVNPPTIEHLLHDHNTYFTVKYTCLIYEACNTITNNKAFIQDQTCSMKLKKESGKEKWACQIKTQVLNNFASVLDSVATITELGGTKMQRDTIFR